MPGRSGASEAPERRAPRTTTYSSASAHSTCAIDGADRGAGQAQPHAVHEDEVERDVHAVAEHRDHQRRPGVLQPAQHPGRREHHQQRRDAEPRDPQVGRPRSPRPRGRARRPRRAARSAAMPAAVTSTPIRTASHTPSMPCASAPRVSPAPTCRATRRGGAVGEEHAQPDRRRQHHRRDALPGELRRAEVPDDRRVRRAGTAARRPARGRPVRRAAGSPGRAGPSQRPDPLEVATSPAERRRDGRRDLVLAERLRVPRARSRGPELGVLQHRATPRRRGRRSRRRRGSTPRRRPGPRRSAPARRSPRSSETAPMPTSPSSSARSTAPRIGAR